MRGYRLAVAVMATVIGAGVWGGVVRGQLPAPSNPQLPGAPVGARGEAIFPAFEAWGPHKDGQNVIMIGYYNRNKDQALDIPVGPNNRVEPGGPDMGQPTHFEPGRHYGVFSIPVPKDAANRKYTWTIVANGQTSTVQFSLNPPYWANFFENPSTGNTPPIIRFAQGGKEFSGPPVGIAETKTATVGQPLTLSLWVSDRPNTYDPEEGLPDNMRTRRDTDPAGRGTDPVPAAPPAGAGADGGGRGRGGAPSNFDVSAASGRAQVRGFGRGSGPQPDITVAWKIHRGASSTVTFGQSPVRLFTNAEPGKVMEATTTATFSAPGEYILRAQVNDLTGDGGGGDLCCWTDALVKVNVK
jgi:hypothetical protein